MEEQFAAKAHIAMTKDIDVQKDIFRQIFAVASVAAKRKKICGCCWDECCFMVWMVWCVGSVVLFRMMRGERCYVGGVRMKTKTGKDF